MRQEASHVARAGRVVVHDPKRPPGAKEEALRRGWSMVRHHCGSHRTRSLRLPSLLEVLRGARAAILGGQRAMRACSTRCGPREGPARRWAGAAGRGRRVGTSPRGDRAALPGPISLLIGPSASWSNDRA